MPCATQDKTAQDSARQRKTAPRCDCAPSLILPLSLIHTHAFPLLPLPLPLLGCVVLCCVVLCCAA
eukprot:jgi/Psemu1/307939/fgenesh1_kg.365_\